MIPQDEFLFCSFFGRIEDTINCFRDLLTSSEHQIDDENFVNFCGLLKENELYCQITIVFWDDF